MKKVKLAELVKVDDLVYHLDLTEEQTVVFNSKFAKLVAEEVAKNIRETLAAGDSVEIPRTANIYVHSSTTLKNEDGEPRKKLSIRTRKQFKEELN